MSATDRKQVEGARTQSLFREVNERIEEVGQGSPADDEVLCECAEQECAQLIAVARAEYEAVRRVATHFILVPGHEVGDIERVVEENERYVVVEKFGAGGVAAVRSDPRRRRGERLSDLGTYSDEAASGVALTSTS